MANVHGDSGRRSDPCHAPYIMGAVFEGGRAKPGMKEKDLRPADLWNARLRPLRP